MVVWLARDTNVDMRPFKRKARTAVGTDNWAKIKVIVFQHSSRQTGDHVEHVGGN